MNKILILVIFILSSFNLEAQSFFRAFQFNIGSKVENKIDWNENAQSCNILIKIEESKATIFSQKEQVYRLVGLLEKTETYSKYRCVNNEGINCNLMMFVTPDTPGVIYFAIEFSDYVWYYATTAN